MRRSGPLVALLVLSACQRQPQTPPGGAAAARPAAVEEGRALLEQGQLDAALAKLQEASGDPDSLYYQGAVWAKKAESAPLPTPPPAPSPLPRGAEPPAAPELKPEELTAIDFFEKALAARPDHGRAHMALADVLAPHSVRRYEREEAAKKKPPVRRGKGPEPTPTPEAGPDYGAERVIREYQLSRQADPKSSEAIERLIRFSVRVGRMDAAAAAFHETAQGQEKPEPYIRYGDFLLNDKKDREAALDQYKQALVWRPDDDATRAKIADIYIGMGEEHYAVQHYALAEARFREAEKFITDRSSPQGVKLQDYMARLKAIRQPR